MKEENGRWLRFTGGKWTYYLEISEDERNSKTERTDVSAKDSLAKPQKEEK